MNNREISKKLWEAYRHAPLVPANLGEHRRGCLRGVIGCVSSLEQLKDSISSHISEGYREDSPFIQTMRTRMNEVNQQLIKYEGFLYGEDEQRA